jgi:hypothetical protein
VSNPKKNSLNKVSWLLLILFLFFGGWFIGIYLPGPLHGKTTVLLSEVYGVVALLGGIYGLAIAKNWGYVKSYFGKAIVLLAVGLLLQEFGQLAYSYLNSVKHVAVPYPSIPDIGFFGAIPAYIIAGFYLMRGLSVKLIIRKRPLKLLIGITIPLVVLAVSYWFFLKGYSTAGKSHAVIFFDFAYPIGEAIYVSIALVILLAVAKLLGGVLRYPVLLLLLAFIVQYASDFNFLYQTAHGTWGPGRYGDSLYFLAYCVLTYSLIKLNGGLRVLMHPKVRNEEA